MLRPFAHDGPAGAPTPPDPAPEVGSDASRNSTRHTALMARPRRGTLKRRPTSRGLSFGVAFTYLGTEYYEHFGGEWEGWDEERAAKEQRFLIEKINRGEWTPPSAGRPSARSAPLPTFQIEASHWLHRQKIRAVDPDGRSKTIRDLEWRLSVVMDKFGPRPLDRVDVALADELVLELCQERLTIELAREQGAPLMRTVGDPRTGRTYQANRRAVSNAAIQRAADLIEADHRGLTWEKVVLIRRSSRSAVALARELGVSDTLVRKVRRGELWNGATGARNRNDVPRRVVVDTLILAGLRVSELCGLNAPHVDIAGARIRVPRSATKTDAGERVVPTVPALRERLAEHRMDYPVGPSHPAFPTRNETRQHPDNVRARILAPIRARANE